VYLGFFDKHCFTYWCILFFLHIVNTFSVTHLRTLLMKIFLIYVRYHWNPEPMCNKSHFVSLFYLYWYFQILLNLFWHTDKKNFFCVEVNSNPLSALSLDPKKSRPRYISAQKISTLFWCTGWAWNWQIIFRFASIHGRVCFILYKRQRALYGIKCVLRIFW
jgi:hypothetical protein